MNALSRYLLAVLLLLPMMGHAQTEASPEGTDKTWNRPTPKNAERTMQDLNAAARFLEEGNRAIERAQNAVPRFLDLAEVYVLRSVGRLSRSEQLTDNMPYLIEHITDIFNERRKKEELSRRLDQVRDAEDYLRQQIFAIRRDLEQLGAGDTIAEVEGALGILPSQAEAARRAGDEGRARQIEAYMERLRGLLDSGNPNPEALRALIQEMRDAGIEVPEINIAGQTPPPPPEVIEPNVAGPAFRGETTEAMQRAFREEGIPGLQRYLSSLTNDPAQRGNAQEILSLISALQQQGFEEPLQRAALELVLEADNPLQKRDEVIELFRDPDMARFFSRLPTAGIEKDAIKDLMETFISAPDPQVPFNELRRLVEEDGLTLQAAIDEVTGRGATAGQPARPSPENRVALTDDELVRIINQGAAVERSGNVVIERGLDLEDLRRGVRLIYADREDGYLTAEIDVRPRAYRDEQTGRIFIEKDDIAERRYSFAIREVQSNRRRQDGQLYTTWELVNRAAPSQQDFSVDDWTVTSGDGQSLPVQADGDRAVVVFPEPGAYRFTVEGETERGSPFTIQLGAGGVPPVNIQF
ncbi:MAG: hypothetical protein ACFB21_15190 [Opitutales bacterium]